MIFYKNNHYIMFLPRDNIFKKRLIYMPEFMAHTHHKYMVYYKRLGGSNYTRDDFTPSPADVAVDVGTYMGKDAAAYARVAKQVISIEASPRNYYCANHNLDQYDNIGLVNKAVWECNDTVQVNYGKSPSDDALIEPDSGLSGHSDHITADTLETILNDLDVHRVGFLKIEAEGAEPEVIKGFGKLKINKIVISSNEERYGEYSYNEVVTELEERDFTVLPFSKKGRVFVEGN
jgi:FkbM family methyltransferase